MELDKEAMKTSLAERTSQNRLLAKESNISSECGCLFENTAAQNICQGVFFFSRKSPVWESDSLVT